MLTRAQHRQLQRAYTMRATELAAIVGVSRRSVFRWAHDGKVRVVLVGNHREYVCADVVAMASGAVLAEPADLRAVGE